MDTKFWSKKFILPISHLTVQFFFESITTGDDIKPVGSNTPEEKTNCDSVLSSSISGWQIYFDSWNTELDIFTILTVFILVVTKTQNI